MNSFILIAHNPDKQVSYLKQFINEHAISPFDQININEEGSIGIEIVRKIQGSLFVKPYKSNAKLITIFHAENLTTEAQNALLKILEEPPTYVFFFLCATTDEVFLPTIRSRCKLLILTEEEKTVTKEEIERLTQQVDTIMNGTISDKLALAEQLALDKENLLSWFEHMILFVRHLMLKDIDKQTALPLVLLSLSAAYKTFQTTNVSPRTILEHSFLTLEQ